jgi:hypothetical protein
MWMRVSRKVREWVKGYDEQVLHGFFKCLLSVIDKSLDGSAFRFWCAVTEVRLGQWPGTKSLRRWLFNLENQRGKYSGLMPLIMQRISCTQAVSSYHFQNGELHSNFRSRVSIVTQHYS